MGVEFESIRQPFDGLRNGTHDVGVRARDDENFAGDDVPVLAQPDTSRLDPRQLLGHVLDAARKVFQFALPDLRWRLVHQIADHLLQVVNALLHNFQ